MEVIGKVIENANYRSLPLVHPDTLQGKQKANTNVIVTGMTITADNLGAETRWYCCALANGNFWIRNDLIKLVDPSALDQLPFITAAEISNPKQLPLNIVNPSASTVLKEVGVALAAGEVMDSEQVKQVLSALKRYGTRLRSTWTVADLMDIISILDRLASLGVVLQGTEGGAWRGDEVRLIDKAISKIASTTAQHFKRQFNVANDLSDVAFRLMYAPLRIIRSPNNNLNPNPKVDPATGKVPIWWARNAQGFELFLGNMVFSGISLKFTSEELIIHEMAHCLNFRYLPSKKFLYNFYTSTGSYTIPAEETFDGKAFKVSFIAIDEGYSTRPRSSDHPAEVVTDAFTNDIVKGYKDSIKGEGRCSEVRKLMQLAIANRIQEFGPARARVKADNDKALEVRLAVPLARLDETEAADLKIFAM